MSPLRYKQIFHVSRLKPLSRVDTTVIELRAASANPDVQQPLPASRLHGLQTQVHQYPRAVQRHHRDVRRRTRGVLRCQSRPQPGLPREGSSCHRLGSHWFGLFPLIFATFSKLKVRAKEYLAPTFNCFSVQVKFPSPPTRNIEKPCSCKQLVGDGCCLLSHSWSVCNSAF